MPTTLLLLLTSLLVCVLTAVLVLEVRLRRALQALIARLMNHWGTEHDVQMKPAPTHLACPGMTMIASLEELRTRIRDYLCEFDQLLPGAFPLVERILVRKGKPCGLYFCLHGPRAVKFSEIWDCERNTVLFYGPDGERYHRMTLTPASGQWQSAVSPESSRRAA